MSDAHLRAEIAALKAEVAMLKGDAEARGRVQREAGQDQYADYRLLRAMLTIWIQQQPEPLRTVDELRKRSLEWQGDMSEATRTLLETTLASIERAAEVIRR